MNIIFFLLLAFFPLIFPKLTLAHAFGQLYTLPIPLWLYLYGAGVALIISFLAIGFFTKANSNFSIPKVNFNLPSWLIFFLKVLSIFLLILTILTGFFGNQSPIENFAVNFFWIIFLLGFTYLSAILGNIWEVINPWKIIIELFGDLKPLSSYPKKFGFLPAIVFYFLLIWLELLSGGLAVHPASLSKIILIYSGITLLAILIFGKVWFEYGEFFSVFFGLISKLSPFSKSNLLNEKPQHFSLLIFILFMLSSTAFDGFRSTIIYLRYFYSLNPIILLIASPIFFLSLYLAAIFLMKILSRSPVSIKELALQFSFSLLPIALAYNVAHYFTLLLISGQSIIPLLSDPFNLGWNLFASSDYQINVGLLGAGLVWHFEVAAIIIGHIMAVILAHLLALKIFSRKQAFLSQIPMLILMVLYTVTGLWILSQPLTIGG